VQRGGAPSAQDRLLATRLGTACAESVHDRHFGVMIAARNLANLPKLLDQTNEEWAKWSADDVSLMTMPIGHIGGTGWGFWTLACGAKGMVLRDFDPGRILDLIEDEKINKVFLVPSALQAIVSHPRARQIDYSHLKYISYGASPIPLALLRECVEVFGCGFVQMYGMTETTGVVAALPPEDHSLEGSPKMRSAGKALPGVEIAILNESGKRLGPSEVGEIAIRSASNMKGYWNLPEATAATIDKEGWLRTGDAGYLDERISLHPRSREGHDHFRGENVILPSRMRSTVIPMSGSCRDRRSFRSVEKRLSVIRSLGDSRDDMSLGARRCRLQGRRTSTVNLPRNASGKF
jgi:acyl-CoA synthetase (AMP-forming)/AMP-acid ligase II